MAKRKEIDRALVKAQVNGLIASAESFGDGDRKGRRELALAYQDGRMPDLLSEEEKSGVVEQLLSDTLSMLKPSLSRVFLSSDRIAIYEPVAPPSIESMPGNSPEEKRKAWEAECERVEDFAGQATDYVNHVFLRECIGEKLIGDVIYDGLLHGNGIIKHWWDKTPKYETEQYTGLSDDDYVEIASDPDVEVLEHSEYEATADEAEAIGSGSADIGGGPGLLGDGDPLAIQPGQPGQPAPLGAPDQAPPAMPMAGGVMAPPAGIAVGMAGPVQPTEPGAAGAMGAELSGAAFASNLSALEPLLGLGGNFPPPPLLHDLKIRRTVSTGRLRIKCLADEDFYIEADATALTEDECRFCAHRDTPTRSQLVERGFDKDLVWELASITDTTEDAARNGRNRSDSEDYEDKAGERVEIWECYALLDPDEDGIAERYQVIVGGNGGTSEILSLEEWGGRLPFSDVVPDPVPHRWMGRSLYDLLRDPQRVSTALSRRINDNAYQAVEPMRAVDWSKVRNPDDLLNIRLGAFIETNGPPAGVIMDLAVPFVAKEAQPLVQEQRHIAERRTGVGEQSAGLDADALTGQVATAVTATQSASGLRKEEMARNIAVGLRRAFACILRLMVENQDRSTTMKLRKEWVEMSPRSWSSEMDVTINVGLGGGNRDRDLTMLQGIYGIQKEVISVLGPTNPVLGIKEAFETARMMVEASGIKAPERFFPDIPDELIEQMKAQASQQAPDPKAMAEQAKLQAMMQKMQADQAMAQQDQQHRQALAQAELQNKLALKEAEMMSKQQAEAAKHERDMAALQMKAQSELMLQQAKNAAQMEIERVKAEAKMQLEREVAATKAAARERELRFEEQLKMFQIAQPGRQSQETNIARPE